MTLDTLDNTAEPEPDQPIEAAEAAAEPEEVAAAAASGPELPPEGAEAAATATELLPEYLWHRPDATVELVANMAARNGFPTMLVTPSPAGFHVSFAATPGAVDPRAHGDAATLLEAASQALESILAEGR